MLCLRLNREIEGALFQLPGGEEPVWEQTGEGALATNCNEGRENQVPGLCQEWEKGEERRSHCNGGVVTGSGVAPTFPTERVQERGGWPARASDLMKITALGCPFCLDRDGHIVLGEGKGMSL